MQKEDFSEAATGDLLAITGGGVAFRPNPAPVGLALPPALSRLIGDTREQLGRLSEGVGNLPHPDLLIRPFQKREAVLSSRIEGTRTTLEEAFVDEATGLVDDTNDDAREVRNYERALRLGVGELAAGRRLTVFLLRALHRELLDGVRGHDLQPGALRDRQVWLGPKDRDITHARFVPPPAHEIESCLRDLEIYLQKVSGDEPLVRVALAHYQFETIHPFLDGNGRVGRLLVALQMVQERLVDQPWLYVSPYLERQRSAYYDGLYRVSTEGDWLGWIEFFVKAILESARDTLARLRDLRRLEMELVERLRDVQSAKPAQLVPQLLALPYITTTIARSVLECRSTKTAQNAIDRLVEKEILQPIEWRLRSGRGRPAKVYRCSEIVRIVEADTR